MIIKLDLWELHDRVAVFRGDTSGKDNRHEAISVALLVNHWIKLDRPTALFIDVDKLVFGWGGEHDEQDAEAVLQDR